MWIDHKSLTIQTKLIACCNRQRYRLCSCIIRDYPEFNVTTYKTLRNLILNSATLFFTLIAYTNTALAEAYIGYSDNPDNLIIRLIDNIGEIESTEGYPTIEVYGDGSVKTYFPAFMKRAGHYRLKLNEEEVNSLLKTISDHQIPTFDTNSIKEMRVDLKSRLSESGELFYSSDPSTSILKIQLDSYSENLNAETPASIDNTIIWHGLRQDAARYKEIEAIQNLHLIQQTILGLAEHPNLVKIKSEDFE